MSTEHPITPTPELVRQWAVYKTGHESPEQLWHNVATQAARWGADQELEACLDELRRWGIRRKGVDSLHKIRRPKPPSLKERALEALETEGNGLSVTAASVIRRALEQLDD